MSAAKQGQAEVGGPPALYARWWRDVAGASDDAIGAAWRMTFPADRKFWAELDAQLAAQPQPASGTGVDGKFHEWAAEQWEPPLYELGFEMSDMQQAYEAGFSAARQPQTARAALEAIARAAQGSMDGNLPLDREWVVTEALRGLGELPGGDEGEQPQPAPELAAAIQDIIDRHPEREKQPAPDHAPSDEQLAAAHATIDRMQQQLLDAGDEIGRLRRGCGVHPGIPGYEHPECGFHWHGKDGADVPLDENREPVCPRCALAAKPRWTERLGPVVACDHAELEDAYAAAHGRITEVEAERDKYREVLDAVGKIRSLLVEAGNDYEDAADERDLLDRALHIAAHEAEMETADAEAKRREWLEEARLQESLLLVRGDGLVGTPAEDEEAREEAEFLADAASLDDLRGDR